VHHDTYRGVPLEEIRIAAVQWPDESAAYIRSRSNRRANDHDVEPEWATEAATSEGAVVSWAPPPEGSDSEESESLVVLGYSAMADAVLKVWLRPIDIAAGAWIGVNAAFAKQNIARRLLGGDWP
jgi:hypothetical protein